MHRAGLSSRSPRGIRSSRDDSGAPNSVLATPRESQPRLGRPRSTRSLLLNFGTVPVASEKHKEGESERKGRIRTRAWSEREARRGSVGGELAGINSQPGALLFTI